MNSDFRKPSFQQGTIELRFESGEICIYGTRAGIEKLISFCKQLLDNPKQGHIHLEDYEALTADSLKGTIAIFNQDN